MFLKVGEEQSNGTSVYKFVASDLDSNIAYFKIDPPNKFFDVEPSTGNLLVKNRIDYEGKDSTVFLKA